MAFSWQQQIYPAGAQNVNVDIAYLDKTYIYVYLDGVLTTNYTWASDSVIRLDDALTKSAEVLLVRRTTKEYLFILFASGAPFISENLDTQNTQFLHLAQEMVEGRSIDGFYGDISMNGFKITNLADGTEPGDAVNKGQLDEVDTRVTQLEQTWIVPSSSYPWFTNTTEETDVLTPGFIFTKAAVYINGVCQTPGYSYEVVDNTIMLADPVPAGTHIMARLGEDVPNEQGYATTAQLVNAVEGMRMYTTESVAEVTDDLYSAGLTIPTTLTTSDFNWGTATYISGAHMLIQWSTSTNRPAGLVNLGNSFMSVQVLTSGTAGAELLVSTNTSVAANFRLYYARVVYGTTNNYIVREVMTFPANKGAAVANAVGSPTQTEFNNLLTSLRNAGIIAT